MEVGEEKKTEEEETEAQRRNVAGYAGSIIPIRSKRKAGWAVTSYRVQIGKRGKTRRETQSFGISEFGTDEKAKEAAEQYRRQRSDALGLTVLHHSCVTDVFETTFKQYVAGLFDGDGCIKYDKTLGIRVTLAQAGPSTETQPRIIQLLQQKYGGSEQLLYETPPVNHRPAWEFRLHNKAAQILVEHISEYGIIKKPQADLVLPFVRKRVPLRHTPAEEAITPEVISRLKIMKKQYASVPIDAARLTPAYLAGLFDAEGCVTLYDKTALKAYIAQNSCVPLLQAIRETLQTGYIDGRSIELSSKFALKLFRSITPFLVIKKPQVDLVLANQNLLTTGLLSTQRARQREEMVKALASMKHEGTWTLEDEFGLGDDEECKE